MRYIYVTSHDIGLTFWAGGTDVVPDAHFRRLVVDQFIQQEWWFSVTDMSKQKGKKKYEAPQVKDHGTLTDLTKGDSGKKVDGGGPPRSKS